MWVLRRYFFSTGRGRASLSSSLNRAERNYTATERECLAVLVACEKFRMYVEGSHFTSISFTAKKSSWPYPMRWAESLIPSIRTLLGLMPKTPLSTYQQSIKLLSLILTPLMIPKIRDNPESYPRFSVNDGKKIFKSTVNPVTQSLEDKLLVPTPFRKGLIEKFHSSPTSGHLEVKKTSSPGAEILLNERVHRSAGFCNFLQRMSTIQVAE